MDQGWTESMLLTFKYSISNIVTKPIPFSDHHGVIIDITLNSGIEMIEPMDTTPLTTLESVNINAPKRSDDRADIAMA